MKTKDFLKKHDACPAGARWALSISEDMADVWEAMIEQGKLDCGFTGLDWILENGADVVEICELEYSKATAQPVRWVLAVHEDSPFQSAGDLAGKKIATKK